jgi:glucokinase
MMYRLRLTTPQDFRESPEVTAAMTSPSATAPILGIDLGGTKVEVSCARLDGEILAARRIPTQPEEGPDRGLERILETVREVLSEGRVAGSELAAVGLSIPGPWDCQAGIFLALPNLPGWEGFPVRQRLSEHFSAPLYMDNDANAAALAEWKFGAGRGYRHLIYLTMSTGIGGGLILDGRLHRGRDANAGEVGHQVIVPGGPVCGCGLLGHLEGLCSGSGIARRLREAVSPDNSAMWEMAGGDPRNLSAEILTRAVRRGDALAGEFFQQTLEYLASGLANLIFMLNPEAIVLGTIVAKNPDLFIEPLQGLVRERVWDVFSADLKILPAQLTDQIGVYAPLALVLDATARNREEDVR